MVSKKYTRNIILVYSLVVSTQLIAREYGEVMSIHSGDAISNGLVIADCYVKKKGDRFIFREINGTE